MSRLTINLPDELHRALKARAARSGIPIARLVTDSLRAYGIKPESEAREIVASARERARMDAKDAEELANEETRRHREE